jgi:deoxyribose-phosphate aldolase
MADVLEHLNRRFDHAALQPEVTERNIITLCREAHDHNFYSVAVNPVWVTPATRELAGSGIIVLSVSGFPLGASRTDVKVSEAVKGVADGAGEIDMVANIGRLVSGEYAKVEQEVAEVRRNLPYNVVLKVIIEAGKLSREQQIGATRCVAAGGAQFVKTSTGFFGGATVEQVRTLHNTAAGQIEVKASGSIRSLSQCVELLNAGATRLGSSASVAIMKDLAAAR